MHIAPAAVVLAAAGWSISGAAAVEQHWRSHDNPFAASLFVMDKPDEMYEVWNAGLGVVKIPGLPRVASGVAIEDHRLYLANPARQLGENSPPQQPKGFPVDGRARVEFCRISDGKVVFVRDAKAEAYSREFLTNAWAAGEPADRRFPIAHLVLQHGQLFVQAFAADYFEASLQPAPEKGLYRISDVNFPLPGTSAAGQDLTERDEALKKFGDSRVSYYLSLRDDASCGADRDLIISVYRSHVHVEDILFHVIDMQGRTDWWR